MLGDAQLIDSLSLVLSGFVIGLLLLGVVYARRIRTLVISEATLKALKNGLSDQLKELLVRNKSLIIDLEKARAESTSFREKISVLQTTLHYKCVSSSSWC